MTLTGYPKHTLPKKPKGVVKASQTMNAQVAKSVIELTKSQSRNTEQRNKISVFFLDLF